MKKFFLIFPLLMLFALPVYAQEPVKVCTGETQPALRWDEAGTLDEARTRPGAALRNGRLYVVGGQTDIPLDSVKSLAISGKEAISARSEPGLNSPASAPGVVAVGDHIYSIGENNEYTSISSISWEPATPLGTPRKVSVVTNGEYIYALGGQGNNQVEFALINKNDGSLGQWLETEPLSEAHNLPAAVIVDGYIYAAGNVFEDLSFPLQVISSVERALINPDGTLSKWEIIGSTTSLNYGFGLAATKNRLFMAGNMFEYRLLIRYADIGPDGTLGPWLPYNLLNYEHVYGPAVVNDGAYMYVVAGGTEKIEALETGLPPVPSDYGVTINDGALFTNKITVTLTIGQPPLWSQLVQVSNDGGFAGAIWQEHNPCQPWIITHYGNYIIPRTVYVRFKNTTTGQLSATFSDDIILDETPPTGSVEVEEGVQGAARAALSEPPITGQANYTVYLPLITKTGPNPNVTLRLTASDDVSGVAEMRVANVPGSGYWQPYNSRLAWYLPAGGTVYVQFKDWAGNVSPVYSEFR